MERERRKVEKIEKKEHGGLLESLKINEPRRFATHEQRAPTNDRGRAGKRRRLEKIKRGLLRGRKQAFGDAELQTKKSARGYGKMLLSSRRTMRPPGARLSPELAASRAGYRAALA